MCLNNANIFPSTEVSRCERFSPTFLLIITTVTSWMIDYCLRCSQIIRMKYERLLLFSRCTVIFIRCFGEDQLLLQFVIYEIKLIPNTLCFSKVEKSLMLHKIPNKRFLEPDFVHQQLRHFDICFNKNPISLWGRFQCKDQRQRPLAASTRHSSNKQDFYSSYLHNKLL